MKIIRVWASIIVFLAAFAFASCSKTENDGGADLMYSSVCRKL